MGKYSVLIVEDHTLLRETWVQLLNVHIDFCVVAHCGSAAEARQLCVQHKPDVIMLDINLPDTNGIDLAAELHRQYPNIHILAVSLHNQSQYAKKIMQNGAKGYVTKNASSTELFHALSLVAKGQKYICNEIKDKLAEQMVTGQDRYGADKLSPRELEVIRWLKHGNSSKEIADKLLVSIKTIEVHRYNILQKLQLKNTAALINYVNRHMP